MRRRKPNGVVEFTAKRDTRDHVLRKSELPKRRPMSRRLRSLCLHDPHISAEEMKWPDEYRHLGSLQKATKEERRYHPHRTSSAIPFGKEKDGDVPDKRQRHRRRRTVPSVFEHETASFSSPNDHSIEKDGIDLQHSSSPHTQQTPINDSGNELACFPVEIRKYMALEKWKEGTPVQKACWKRIVDGKNCRVMSQPGTGKTLAFLLPIAVVLNKPLSEQVSGPRALIFVPTRELADQILTVCSKLWKLFKLKTVSVCGGSPIASQIEEIRHGADILVGTPGRFVELLYDKHIVLDQLKIVVLDEADKMLSGDLGRQLDGLKDYVIAVPTRPQVCAFSATLPQSVDKALTEWTGVDAVSLSFSTDASLVSPSITQVVHVCAEHKKLTKLRKHLKNIQAQQKDARQRPRILIFANTIKKVRAIFTALQQEDFRIAMLHGKRTQSERLEALQAFRSGKSQVLVATDVAGRGLDVRNLPYVVNYDFPSRIETYIHRIGRTGRLAADGHAFSFFTRNFAPLAEDLVALLRHHEQEIDPNLKTLVNSYHEAASFMTQLEQIENEAETTNDDGEASETKQADPCLEMLSPKKRRRVETPYQTLAVPVFMKNRRHGV